MLTSPLDGTGRLFIVEQEGRILIVKKGADGADAKEFFNIMDRKLKAMAPTVPLPKGPVPGVNARMQRPRQRKAVPHIADHIRVARLRFALRQRHKALEPESQMLQRFDMIFQRMPHPTRTHT